MSRKTRYAMRVRSGAFVPADTPAKQMMTVATEGELAFIEVAHPRNPGYHRLAHALGSVIAENLDPFTGLDGHAVLKRLQIESGIGCDEVAVVLNGLPCLYRVPRSLSFESMGQKEFEGVFRGLCAYVARRYWQTTPDEVRQIAEESMRASA